MCRLELLLFFKAHPHSIPKFCTNATAFGYDLLETLPKCDGSEVGTRIRCQSLNALKVALLQHAFGRMTDKDYSSIQDTTWDDKLSSVPANNGADLPIFQASFWVWENKNN